ncbi:hypothetical protein RJ639_019381 [Escallonia herrerae]|uniref:Uncharacterized protein n=1 Tax=Escallonia herrerae TaxID=1293975 RepID=A0AA88V7V3_9ASTE|nr:hypothetical protein RJ639_019381 [Escallonia herrerae]
MDVNDRKECQAKVLNTMRLSLAFEVKYSVLKETSPLAICSKLKKIYPSKSLTNRLYLKKQLYDLQMDDGSNIREIAQLKALLNAKFEKKDLGAAKKLLDYPVIQEGP